ncbi:MAG: VPLPA-CTERM sorting domain-containing protein [Sphingomicrobium sp.]
MPAQAATYATYGDAFNNGTAFDLTSYGSSGVGYSGLEMQPSGTLTLGAITQLSSDYNMISGSFGGGAPRFTLFDQNLNAVYAYWGTPLGGGSFANPVPDGTPSNTGNYADLLSTDVRFYSNGFGGLNSPNSGLTWAQLVAAVGSTDVTWVTLDLDGGFTGDQHLLVNNFAVNGDVFSAAPSTTPLPAALPMFATGMAGLGLLRWRRKNKSAAKAA